MDSFYPRENGFLILRVCMRSQGKTCKKFIHVWNTKFAIKVVQTWVLKPPCTVLVDSNGKVDYNTWCNQSSSTNYKGYSSTTHTCLFWFKCLDNCTWLSCWRATDILFNRHCFYREMPRSRTAWLESIAPYPININ